MSPRGARPGSAGAPRPARVRPFPWESLEHFGADEVAQLPRLRQLVPALLPARAFQRSLGALLGADVRVAVHGVVPLGSGTRGPHRVQLELSDGSLALDVVVEDALARRVAARLAGRAVAIALGSAERQPSLEGALAALVLEALRGAGSPAAWQVRHRPLPTGAQTQLGLTLHLAGQAYAVTLVISPHPTQSALARLAAHPRSRRAVPGSSASAEAANAPSTRPREPRFTDRAALLRLGALPITLHLIAACSLARLASLAGLRVGDVWLLDDWPLDPADLTPPTGEASTVPARQHVGVLASALATRGVALRFSLRGRVVLGEEPTGPLDLPRSREPSPLRPSAGLAPEQSPAPTTSAMPANLPEDPALEPPDALAEAVLETPVVVRLEVAAVTLSASEWAELRPGDILATDQPLGEPAVLRAGGRELARGELVSVDGKLGVRIQSLNTRD